MRHTWGAQGALELRLNHIWTVEDAPGAYLNCVLGAHLICCACAWGAFDLWRMGPGLTWIAPEAHIWSVKDEPGAHLNCPWGTHLICLACAQAHLNCAWDALDMSRMRPRVHLNCAWGAHLIYGGCSRGALELRLRRAFNLFSMRPGALELRLRCAFDLLRTWIAHEAHLICEGYCWGALELHLRWITSPPQQPHSRHHLTTTAVTTFEGIISPPPPFLSKRGIGNKSFSLRLQLYIIPLRATNINPPLTVPLPPHNHQLTTATIAPHGH